MVIRVTEIRETTCPYCGVGCGVDATVKDDNLIAVSGSSRHPANLGRLCVKGSALHETMGLKGRLLYPQIHGDRVDWDTALDAVAQGFSRIVDEHGPNAVAFYLSGQLLTEDYYVGNKLMKGFIGSANVDTNSRLCMASAVAGYKRAFGADAVPCSYQDLETCDLLVMVGSNAAWTHPVLYQRIQAAKKARPGMRVVVIDPRDTATCDIADLHLDIRPGGDGYLFAGLLKYLSDHGLTDEDYIRAHTEGFEEAIRRTSLIDLATLHTLLGVDKARLETFFRWFGETRKTVTFYSQGINQSATGTDKCNAIINCHLATGRIGGEGMGPFSITGQPNAMGGREVGGLANQLAAHMNFMPEDIDRVSRFWNAENIATEPGLKAVDLFDAIERGEVKAVWIMATNPVVSLPDADRVRAALEKCELVVVSDAIADTDTTECADILLPATGWGEKDGTVTNSERRISRQRGLEQPPGEARHDWRIICDVAARMGFGDAFAFASPRDIFCEHARLSGFENHGGRIFDISALAELSEDEYETMAPVQWPVTRDNPEGTDRLFADGRFITASGKARFVDLIPQLPRQGRGRLFPFILNTGRIRDQWHTMTRTARSPRLLSHIESPYVSFHEKDAACLNIRDGDLVEVASERGRVILRAVLDNSVRQGELFAPIHWNDQYASRARVGALIAPRTDPVSGQPESKFVPVKVRKLKIKCWIQLASRVELPLEDVDFWVKTPIENGVRYYLGMVGSEVDDAVKWVKSISAGYATLEFFDEASGEYRVISRDDDGLSLLAFVAASRETLPEGVWLGEAFSKCSEKDIWRLLTGKHPDGLEKGRKICSCFDVGEREILRAIGDGATSTDALGKVLKCGTNCGSCLPELQKLIDTGRGGKADSNAA